MKKTSVALCTYNGEVYLEKQLNSILSQTRKVDEIVICDDCSTDDTLFIIKTYQKQYPDLIRLYPNKTRLGSTKNFEKAINLCSNELIFLCDQDDIWLPQKVNSICHFFDVNPTKSAVFHNLFLYKNNQKMPFTMWDSLEFHPTESSISLFNFLLIFGNMATGMAIAIRKPKKPIFFSEKGNKYFLHDYFLALDYASKNQLLYLDKCLGLYRIHPAQQVGYRENSNFDKDYFQKIYNNPICLYLFLHKRIIYLTKHKHTHKQMPEFIQLLKKKRKNLPRSFSIKQLPFFTEWIFSRIIHKITHPLKK